MKQNTTDDIDNSAPALYEPRMISSFSMIDKSLIQKLDTFFKTHTLKIDLSEPQGSGARQGGGGGGGKRKRGE